MVAIWRPTKQEGEPSPEQNVTVLKGFFLHRLYRLVQLDARRSLSAEQRRLLNYALDATYRDCLSVGARAQARTLLGLPPTG